MTNEQLHTQDSKTVLSHQHDNGANLWATADKKLLKSAPFTTLENPLYLLDLGLSPDSDILCATADLIFQAWQADSRFRISQKEEHIPAIVL